MSKHKKLLFLVLVLAVVLRFYKLGHNPPSLDWDEASLGYNAYSLLKTGKDEFGRWLPVSIRSFEDYKPAMYTYLTVPSIAAFGLNEFATRLPSAICGTLTVLVTYLLVKEIFPGQTKLALLTTTLMSISPWHLQFSRVAFEANIGLFFITTAIWFFLKAIKQGKWMIWSAVFFVMSVYSYHSPRLVAPLLLLGWCYYFRRQLWKKKKWVILSLIVGAVLLVPFITEVTGKGGARLASVTVLTPEGRLDRSIKKIEYDRAKADAWGSLLHNRRIIYAKEVARGYLDHFNLDFLFLTGDAPGRHHAQDMGMLYIWTAPFILIGILQLIKTNKASIVLWWFLVAPAASAITTGTPHAVRALTYLPLYQLFASVGILTAMRFIRNKTFSVPLVYSLIIFSTLFIATNIFYYLQMYYVHTPVEVSQEWQYGFKQVAQYIKPQVDQVDKIVITYAYDQPHVFTLFYQQIDPSWYQQQWEDIEVERFYRKFGKYEFRHIDWEQDKHTSNTLYVGSSGEIPDTATGLVKTIYFLDNTVAFRIVKT